MGEIMLWYEIIENFNSRRYLFLEISALEFDANHGFRVGVGIHKLFWWVVGGEGACGGVGCCSMVQPIKLHIDHDSSQTAFVKILKK